MILFPLAHFFNNLSSAGEALEVEKMQKLELFFSVVTDTASPAPLHMCKST